MSQFRCFGVIKLVTRVNLSVRPCLIKLSRRSTAGSARIESESGGLKLFLSHLGAMASDTTDFTTDSLLLVIRQPVVIMVPTPDRWKLKIRMTELNRNIFSSAHLKIIGNRSWCLHQMVAEHMMCITYLTPPHVQIVVHNFRILYEKITET